MSKREILQDHKQEGKQFVPPYLYKIGPISEISWTNQMVPELIWIGLIIKNKGFTRGVEISQKISNAAVTAHKIEKIKHFSWLSTYQFLSKNEIKIFIDELKTAHVLDLTRECLDPLLSLYPKSPLSFLEYKSINAYGKNIELIKTVLEEIYDRRGVFATRVQSTAIYLAFLSGFLKVSEKSSLADFPEIENFPHTEKSKKIASSIRASLNTIYGVFRDEQDSSWPTIFWNRGLELEQCKGLSDYQDEMGNNLNE